MSRRLSFLALFAGCCPPVQPHTNIAKAAASPELRELALPDETHLKNLHQLTFGADNAEAYWSFAGDKLIFQTNHKPYGCDQIEMMPSSGGPAVRISHGGRTTCSYFLKGDHEIIYASTQAASPECPTPPDMSKGYYWGLFEYDIYRANADGSNLRRLTDTPGYDAEGTVCPVDNSILFTSVRSGDLELWRMDADGKNPRQLTNTPGYDGGGVWSPDCTKIAWRASRPTGKDLDEYKALLAQKLVKPTKMDLWVANADGTEARQITYLSGASFGPYFYPSGKRIIFASNYLNPRGPEFDLYGIDSDGTHLEKLTSAPSFDGFPMFSPDGTKLAFSSNRRDVVKTDKGEVYRMTGGPAGVHDTNVFVADWVDHVDNPVYAPESAAPDRFMRDDAWLADDAREGRGIGTKGLADSADYVQQQLERAGLEVRRQTFDVTTAIVETTTGKGLTLDGKPVTDYVPAPYSASAKVDAPVVAVGWGLDDDYKGKDVKTKVVLVHRFAPDPKDPHSDPRYKAFLARGHGAAGLIVVDDGDPKQDEAELPALAPKGEIDANAVGMSGDAGIPVLFVKRAAIGKGVKRAKIAVVLTATRTPTENVIGILRGNHTAEGAVVVGAHLDHLGMGGGWNALDPKVHAVHNGADDNASGVAAMLEVARTLGAKKGELAHDVYFIAFSGEEEGDLGSADFVAHPIEKQSIFAMINMDMVGRMRNDKLIVNGGDSAKEWHDLVQPACDAARVDCTIGGSGYGPSDQMSFYVAGVPVLFLFTGSHLDYHTATDDSDKINAAGGAQVAKIVADVTRAVANRSAPLTYVKSPPESSGGDVRHIGASLGTVPSYTDDPGAPPGVQLSDVVPDGPAQKAGLHGGDRIVQVGAVEVRNINDLMFVLQAAKPGTETTVVFVRDGKRQTATATFGVPRGRR
jgi:Tol biopolymer transport system component/Iap family predicted aminopeptidase